jgi:hypothetical protein
MKKLKLLLFLGLSANLSFSQGYSEYESGVKVKLNADGTKYIRFINWNQVWLRYNDNNSGSTLMGKPQAGQFDIGLRRVRFLNYAQISDKFLIVTHFGINNQSAFSGGVNGTDAKKPQMFFHDAYVDYKVFKTKNMSLNMGAGLHYFNGISRMTSTSTLNFLAFDAPIFNWPTIDKTDQFARKIGVFAKGKINKLDYRVSVNQAFQANTAKTINVDKSEFNPYSSGWQTAGYFNWQFFDQESNLLPYFVGTYLGSKKVFNVGVGFEHQKNAMWHKTSTGDTVQQDQLLLGADVFLDLPLNAERKDAITFYGSYYNYNFGKNYVRSIGIMNPVDGGGTYKGNALPMVGTGSILYGQLGYLLPKFSEKYRVQPYAAYTHSTFDGLKNSAGSNVAVNMLDAGLNVYLAGHHSKMTLNYRARPDFSDINAVKNRGEVTLQFMVYL